MVYKCRNIQLSAIPMQFPDLKKGKKCQILHLKKERDKDIVKIGRRLVHAAFRFSQFQCEDQEFHRSITPKSDPEFCNSNALRPSKFFCD